MYKRRRYARTGTIHLHRSRMRGRQVAAQGAHRERPDYTTREETLKVTGPVEARFVINEIVTNRAGIAPSFFTWISVHIIVCVCVCVCVSVRACARVR